MRIPESKLGWLALTLALALLLPRNASAAVYYVNAANPSPVAPYTDWSTAATNIQAAVDAASAGDVVLVTNGIYRSGGRVVYGTMTNRVAVTKAITIQSVNGPEVTIIQGFKVSGTIYGDTAIRCVYLTNGSMLAGFTLTNGATRQAGDFVNEQSGGGVWCASSNVVVSNCVLAWNSAYDVGGGAYLGNLTACTLTSNSVSFLGSGGGAFGGILAGCLMNSNSAPFGGGVEKSVLTNCTLIANHAGNSGGGADSSTLNNCTLSGNSAADYGGGASFSLLTNCTISGNVATYFGGGAYSNTLVSCTISSNSVTGGSLAGGGGAYQSKIYNCLLSSNTAAGSYGGGANGCILTNCTLTTNAANFGAGAYNGRLTNCILAGNSGNYGAGVGGSGESAGIVGGIAVGCTLSNNSGLIGAGVYDVIAINCTIIGNSTTGGGGGASSSVLTNCVLTGNNSSGSEGGGSDSCALYNCTVAANSAVAAGGVFRSTLDNCIVYFNTASGGNYDAGSTFNYCCTTPLPGAGANNFANDPTFVDLAVGNYRLQSNSPCINAGNNAYVVSSTDLDGNPRISGGTVDVGAYEFQNPTSIISYAWLQQYGLPTDGSADYVDTDGDGMNNWQEWRAGTDPTNPLSVLKMLSVLPVPGGTNATVTWNSVSNRNYYMQRASDLGVGGPTPFSTLQSNITGLQGTTSWMDTNAPAPGPAFYRVGVQ